MTKRKLTPADIIAKYVARMKELHDTLEPTIADADVQWKEGALPAPPKEWPKRRIKGGKP